MLLDVCRRPVFEAAGDTLPGAVWRDSEEVAVWSADLTQGAMVILYCVHGHAVSQGVAAQLREAGFDARYLEGGIEGWKAAEGETDVEPNG